MEIIPSELRNIERKPIYNITHRRSTIDNMFGYETLHDAILVSQDIGASFLSDVVPQNLLFIFSQCMKPLLDLRLDAFKHPPFLDFIDEYEKNAREEKDYRGEKENTNNFAIVLCKLKYSNQFEKLLRYKEKRSSDTDERCCVSWSELEKFKKIFRPVHCIDSLNDMCVGSHIIPQGVHRVNGERRREYVR